MTMNVYGLTIVLKNKKRHSTPMCAMPRTLRMPLFWWYIYSLLVLRCRWRRLSSSYGQYYRKAMMAD